MNFRQRYKEAEVRMVEQKNQKLKENWNGGKIWESKRKSEQQKEEKKGNKAMRMISEDGNYRLQKGSGKSKIFEVSWLGR